MTTLFQISIFVNCQFAQPSHNLSEISSLLVDIFPGVHDREASQDSKAINNKEASYAFNMMSDDVIFGVSLFKQKMNFGVSFL